MIEKWGIPVTPVTGKAPRTVYVYLPRAAEKRPKARFPVLYMFDGHNVFFDRDATYGKAWGLGEYLDETDTPLIVAAVDCNHRPPHGRLSEYSPFPFALPGEKRIVGRGKKFMDWLTGTLKPLIDQKYPTLPDRGHTFIAGSSMGGLMSLYALTKYNAVFSRAAALSPSLWAGDGRMTEIIRRAAFDPDTAAYLDYGTVEMENHADMQRYFWDAAAALAEKGLGVTARTVAGGRHCEADWQKRLPAFVPFLLGQDQ
ncbi:MAG: alpha/beta hydrolase [Clostridiales bacterium]|nr:alpha/beta hydrolase [Clostridiales bacterium]